MHIVGCLLTFFISLILIVFVALRQITSRFLGAFKKMDPRQQQQSQHRADRQNSRQEETTGNNSSQQKQSRNGKHKVFEDNEGEYVDFEEIKK